MKNKISAISQKCNCYKKENITDSEIELVAEVFSEYESKFFDYDSELGMEWFLSHAFQLGAKWMRDKI